MEADKARLALLHDLVEVSCKGQSQTVNSDPYVQVERLTLEATYAGDPSLPASPLARTISSGSSASFGRGGAGASPWKPSAVALWMPPGTKPTKVRKDVDFWWSHETNLQQWRRRRVSKEAHQVRHIGCLLGMPTICAARHNSSKEVAAWEPPDMANQGADTSHCLSGKVPLAGGAL